LDRFNGQRQANWQRLEDFFAGRPGVTTGRTTDGARTTWMRFCLSIDEDAPFTRTQIQEFLVERGVETRMVWTGNILRQPGFAKIPHRAPADGLTECDRVMDTAMSLPIHHGLNADHMGYICEQLDALYDAYA
jgi:CDP-6-deoxy-D-xylo-4-hexulose-3-dehydrase